MRALRNFSWPRILAEGTIIVVSILLAFGIQAWWEERKDRLDEAELLSRLRTEFTSNLARIDARSSFRLMLDRNKEMFELASSAPEPGGAVVSVPALTIRVIAMAPTYEAETPVFDGLVRSGRMEVIESREIRVALAAWERLLRDYTALAEGPASLSGDDQEWLDLVEIRADAELRGIISGRYNSGLRAQEKFDEVRQATIGVIEAVDRHWAGQ